MRRRRGRAPRTEPISEINITPFTDVLLVLLIIFMLAGSAVPLVTGASLETTPAAAPSGSRAPAEPASAEPPVLVLVDAAGELRDVRGRLFTQTRLRELSRGALISLSAPEERSVELVVGAHDRLLDLGFTSVQFAAPEPTTPTMF